MKFTLSTKQQIVLATSMICLAVIFRLLPHPANVSPIAALALFGGVYFNKKFALILPLVGMMISDIFLGFHQGMMAVYGSFLLTGVIGLYLRNHKHIGTIIAGSLTSSVLFFLITNVNWWYIDALYPKTWEGLMLSYTNALPFFRNTLLGDLFYTGIFFGGYNVILRITESRIMNQELRKVENSV